MNHYQEGAKHARDSILATIIGLQNENGKPESETYQAYQKLYELIAANYGDIYEPFKG